MTGPQGPISVGFDCAQFGLAPSTLDRCCSSALPKDSDCAAVFGQAASIRPELTAIIVALEDSPGDEELTLLTDSES